MRLRDGVEPMPPMMALGAADDLELARRAGEQIAFDLRRAGCTMDFAPVLDLALDPRNTVIGTRSFGADPQQVAELGAAFGRGLRAGGILPCYKHFPGHGATAVDSHEALPAIEADEATLRARDLVPFAAVARRSAGDDERARRGARVRPDKSGNAIASHRDRAAARRAGISRSARHRLLGDERGRAARSPAERRRGASGRRGRAALQSRSKSGERRRRSDCRGGRTWQPRAMAVGRGLHARASDCGRRGRSRCRSMVPAPPRLGPRGRSTRRDTAARRRARRSACVDRGVVWRHRGDAGARGAGDGDA